uniref:Uncharacterized protein n=1 Tax=Strigops habroptila TaxID=2489341 RepID=A0A672TXF8_STRHB
MGSGLLCPHLCTLLLPNTCSAEGPDPAFVSSPSLIAPACSHHSTILPVPQPMRGVLQDHSHIKAPRFFQDRQVCGASQRWAPTHIRMIQPKSLGNTTLLSGNNSTPLPSPESPIRSHPWSQIPGADPALMASSPPAS